MAPPPVFVDIWHPSKQSVSAHPARRQAMASLETGWVELPLWLSVSESAFPVRKCHGGRVNKLLAPVSKKVNSLESKHQILLIFVSVRIGTFTLSSGRVASDLSQGVPQKDLGPALSLCGLPPDLGLKQPSPLTR